jgi:hypothetical protein
MIATALDHIRMPPCARLLGWRLVDARPQDGWIKIGFDGKPDFCNPAGFVQGGILSAMLDDTMGPAVFVMSDGRLYTTTITMTVVPGAGKTRTDHGRGDGDPARQDHRLRRGPADRRRRCAACDRDEQHSAGRSGAGASLS